VIITHSHIGHYGGVLGVMTTADLEAGNGEIYAPVGFTGAALNESVIGVIVRRAYLAISTAWSSNAARRST
jgi:alkyl sulfatase BDS1-like metallo-beta-lactamase superfamily hydrolase